LRCQQINVLQWPGQLNYRLKAEEGNLTPPFENREVICCIFQPVAALAQGEKSESACREARSGRGFRGLNARIQLLPVMNADDLKKGLDIARHQAAQQG
jgi:hypothetical protein